MYTRVHKQPHTQDPRQAPLKTQAGPAPGACSLSRQSPSASITARLPSSSLSAKAAQAVLVKVTSSEEPGGTAQTLPHSGWLSPETCRDSAAAQASAGSWVSPWSFLQGQHPQLSPTALTFSLHGSVVGIQTFKVGSLFLVTSV